MKVKFERSFSLKRCFCGFSRFFKSRKPQFPGKECVAKRSHGHKDGTKAHGAASNGHREGGTGPPLAGGGVERERYATGSGLQWTGKKLLEKGALITMRPHTVFCVSAPLHNYVEIMYMCSGQMVHSVDGAPPLTLRQGELLFLNQHAVHSVERADLEDIGVNLIVLPQFFDLAFEMIGSRQYFGEIF